MKKISLLKKIALGIGLLLYATTMSAADIFVSADGTNLGAGTEADPLSFNQSLIEDVAVDGDRIVVMGNIVLGGSVDIIGKSLTITGYNALNDPDGESNAASLDGSESGAILNISGTCSVTISNLVLKNATDQAIQIDGTEAELSVNIGYCLFKNNSSASPSTDGPDNGAGVTVSGGAMVNIFSSWFQNNQAYRGGALFVDGSTVNVEYCDFDSNFARKDSNGAAEDANSSGGAIAAAGAFNLSLNYCGFSGNYSHRGGGAFFIYGEGTLNILNSYIIGNYSGKLWKDEMVIVDGVDTGTHTKPGDNNGGAMLLYGTSEINIINTTIANNIAHGDARGGAILIQGGLVTSIVNTTITNNKTYGNAFHTGGLSINENASVKIYNSIVERNIADGGSWFSDISGYGTANTIDVKNSVIGATGVETVSTLTIDGVSKSYGKEEFVSNDGISDGLNESGLGTLSINCVPLNVSVTTDGTILTSAYAATLGDPLLLGVYDITTDQNGNERNMSGAIYAGAVEISEPATGSYVLPAEKPAEFDSYSESTGIYDIASDGAIAIAYYTILGQKLDKEPSNGLFIVKYSNGKTVKVIK